MNIENYKFHKELVDIADHSFNAQLIQNNNIKSFNDWDIINVKFDPKTNFKGVAYKKGNNIVFSYAGTDPKSIKDWYNNVQTSTGFISDQSKEAFKFYEKTMKKYPNHNYYNTGFSEGGAEAQLVVKKYGGTAVTFDSLGVKNVVKRNKAIFNKDPKIINYGIKNDATFNLVDQIGEKYILKNPSYQPNLRSWSTALRGGPASTALYADKEIIEYYIRDTHKLEHFKNLQDAQKVDFKTSSDKKPTTPKEFKDIETKNTPMKHDALKQEGIKGLPDPKLEALKNLPVPAKLSTSGIIKNFAVSLGIAGAVAGSGALTNLLNKLPIINKKLIMEFI